MPKPEKRPQIQELAHEIFVAIEGDQVEGFISDGLNVLKTREKLFATLRGNLRAKRKTVRTLEAFLSKYDAR